MYYMTTREYVKAWRNDGINPPEWTAEYGVQINLTEYVHAVRIGNILVFTGDWFVVDKNEDCFSMNDEDFNDMYEVVK